MARIWSMMDVGKRSLANNQTALQTVTHNVANKSTEGYSRQRVDFQTNEPTGEGRLRIGMGAKPTVVSRTNNNFLEKQIEREGMNMGHMEGRATLLSRVEQVYNEQLNKGLNQYMTEFFNSLRELANNPESLASRTMVKESAGFLVKDFHRVNSQLSDIQTDADHRIQNMVAQVNQYSGEIAQLNERIQTVEVNGSPANDERDRRDLLVKKLGQLINIRYAEGQDGMLTVSAGNTAILVSGYSHRDLTVASTSAREGKREGNIEIFYASTENGTPINVTTQLTGGQIGGLLDVRDRVVNRLLDNMDHLAYTLSNEVNKAHVEGYNRYNKTGQLFFTPQNGVVNASKLIGLNKDIAEDVGLIAAAASPSAPGDNRIANILSSLQYKKTVNDSTMDDYYASVVGQVGIEANRANTAMQSQKDILSQLNNLRESISGVSLDEETTKMIEFQKNYEASARLIKTADEMMDTVLNLKRI